MKKLHELFANCAWNIPYKQAGDNVSYAFVEEGTSLYIYFQGSHEKIDWFRNFFFFPKWIRPYEDMKIKFKVHRGFLKAWDEVKYIVKDKILEKDNDTYKWQEIIIVGYSHGGALSGLCFEFCQFWRSDLHEKNLIHGYGFESPRFLHAWKVPKELKERWRNYFVIRTGKDLVTHCPPRLFKFCHVGELIEVPGDPSLVSDKVPKCIKYHYPQVVYKAIYEYDW